MPGAHDGSRPPPRDGFAEWSIPKEDWDAFVARSSRPTVIVLGWLVLLVTVGLCVGLPAWLVIATGLPVTSGLIIAGIMLPFLLLCGFFIVKVQRATQRWRDRAADLWDERGCVCPTCFAPLTRYAEDRENCGHGYIIDDQPLVVRYLETIATASFEQQRDGAGRDELAALRDRAEARGTATRGGFGAITSTFRRAWERWFGFDQPLWRRAVSHCVVIGLPAAIVLPFSLVGASAFLWVIGFALVGARALAKSKHRAKRGERGALRYRLLAAACGFLAFVFPTSVAPAIGRNLPTNVLFAIGERIPEANRDTFDVLAARPLSAQDQQRLAEAMLPYIAEWARGKDTVDRARHAQHIAACLARGTLPEGYAAALADATVFLAVDVGGRTFISDGEVFELPAALAARDLPVTMRFDGNGFTTKPALGMTVGCVVALEIDGEGLWDARTARPQKFGSRVTATLGFVDEQGNPDLGDHQVVVRGYICITPNPAFIAAFDQDGSPALPPASLGPWPVERRFTIRVR